MAALFLALQVSASGRLTREVSSLRPGAMLVADRSLKDPNFSQTVVLLVRYTKKTGAYGLIINRRTSMRLRDAWPELEGPGNADFVHIGGPVDRHRISMLVGAADPGERAKRVVDGVYYSIDRELLTELSVADERTHRVHAGYAGWAPGQLEHELRRGGWFVAPADAAAVFDPEPETLWQRLVPADPTLSASLRPVD